VVLVAGGAVGSRVSSKSAYQALYILILGLTGSQLYSNSLAYSFFAVLVVVLTTWIGLKGWIFSGHVERRPGEKISVKHLLFLQLSSLSGVRVGISIIIMVNIFSLNHDSDWGWLIVPLLPLSFYLIAVFPFADSLKLKIPNDGER
jgi:hypothetical protein